jgi:hypothetical protein
VYEGKEQTKKTLWSALYIRRTLETKELTKAFLCGRPCARVSLIFRASDEVTPSIAPRISWPGAEILEADAIGWVLAGVFGDFSIVEN